MEQWCRWVLPSFQGLEIAAFVSVLVFIVGSVLRSRNRSGIRDANLPPGSYGMPIVGETVMYMASMRTSSPSFMAERRHRYGDTFKSRLMGARCVVPTTSNLIKHVLGRDGKQFETGYPTTFRKVLGESAALSLRGERWKCARRFLVHSFRAELLRARVSVVEELVLANLASWQAKDRVCVRDETKALAFNVVAHFLLGSRLASGEVNDALRKDFYVVTEGLFALPIKLPGSCFAKALQARARIIDTLEREVVSKPRPVGDEDQYVDYMEHLRKARLPGMTEELLVEQTQCHILGLMFAGHETVACTMLFAVKYIMEHPHVLLELRAEHEKIRAAKLQSGRGLTWDDYKTMKYTQHVITETMRLANPVALLWREAQEDMELNGHLVPKGWKAVCAIREAHHDPIHFPNPWQFDPLRHEKGQEVSNLADKPPFFGFGWGPRHCPGAELARMETSIFLHHLVTKFDMEACGEENMSFFPIPKMNDGLQIHARQRIVPDRL